MKPKDKYITLLKEQIDKLDSKTFDLTAWKQSTILILSSAFGQNDVRIKAIESIEYEYSSWSLRDESGNKDPIKILCRETLQTIIKEIELSDSFVSGHDNCDTDLGFIWEAFENDLTGARSKALKKLLSEENNQDIKNTEIDILLQELPDETKRSILKHILLSEEIRKWLLK